MSPSEPDPRLARLRREPPRFRRVSVHSVEPLTPRLMRVTFRGPELEGFTVADPAASIRLLLPSPGSEDLEVPAWNGNEFLLADGRRPIIRTFTPYRVDGDPAELELWMVVHGDGPASDWAATAAPGNLAAVSGPGRGYAIKDDAPAILLAGDETAIPAISQILIARPDVPAQVHIEVARPEARLAIVERPNATITWWDLPDGARPGDMLVDAVTGAELAPGTLVWAAGEAAAVQRIRRHLFDDLGVPRGQTTVRGYWKHGRGGDPNDG
jgi:NADPH-dependent ferric siderophore reductase